MTITAADTTPRVWPACLSCYNNARLVGQWVDCTDAADVTLHQLHEGTGSLSAGCEEIWCLDTENIPVEHEMGLLEAAEWGRVYTEVGPEHWPALYAWVESGDYVAEGTGDLPSISDFVERYCGHWESFREYARELAYDIGLLADVPEEIARYFDWSAWTRDLAFDYSTCDDPEGGVYVFRVL